ncbi:VOC family protein [Dyadobacter diqingensis]|uniref:VOC family protein n=1 Tax=Dyadobacter diqingensis TaxID=2938121 RepID=UPI0020C22F11|nr:VOC family protein [Dyadobacter diqingensis]
MNPEFPAAVPEIPVSDLTSAAAYYERVLGFSIDWGGEDGGITGISKGHCRMFLTDNSFREHYRNKGPVLVWINLDSKEQVYELYRFWSGQQARIVSPPEAKPWGLYEFTVADPDNNLFRIFYDFATPEREGIPGSSSQQ